MACLVSNKIETVHSRDTRGREHRVHVHANQGGRGGGAEQDPVGAVRAGLTPAARAPAPRPPAPPQGRHLLRAPEARLLLLRPGPRTEARAQKGTAPQRLHGLRYQVLLRARRQIFRNRLRVLKGAAAYRPQQLPEVSPQEVTARRPGPQGEGGEAQGLEVLPPRRLRVLQRALPQREGALPAVLQSVQQVHRDPRLSGRRSVFSRL